MRYVILGRQGRSVGTLGGHLHRVGREVVLPHTERARAANFATIAASNPGQGQTQHARQSSHRGWDEDFLYSLLTT